MSTATTAASYFGAPALAAGTPTDLLIIGSSQSGVQLAVSLRALGWTGHITLLGDEDHRPYQRPALSKEYLQGKVQPDSLIFRSNDYWIEHNVTLVRAAYIAELRQEPDGSGVAVSSHGEEFAYRRLALTVGASPRRLGLEGTELPGVLYLRNADDAIALKAAAPEATDVVVIGGGFIGLEAACSLHDMGKRVTVLEVGPRIIGRAVGEATSEYFLRQHRERGIDIRTGATLESIVPGPDGRVAGVKLGDGSVVPAQIVLIGIGVIPNTSLAEQLGLEVENGIVVDANAVTSDGVTLAVGDVANLPNPIPGSEPGSRVRLESVNNAIEHAKVAAYAVTGRREEYAGIPWFWSNQSNLKLQIAGLSTGFDQTVLRHDEERGKFSVLYYREGRIIAADCVNAPLDFMAVKAALSTGQTIPADAAADVSTQLKSLVVPA
ncbi:NAD(P)/FAD-dependent oxidoreductase [Galactobacter valiniphilus]|uniref:NAD(P)/FAD-dependent oxidoreductase n=1 Tax=Galactobacter valiniphilus TaxID=2676122 RepID=UPI003736C55B